MKVGDYIEYRPRILTEDKVTRGKVTMFEPAGNIFNQPMLCIDEVEHWIPANECTVIEES